MKYALIIFSLCFFSQTAISSIAQQNLNGYQLSVTSFHSIGTGLNLAEACGKVVTPAGKLGMVRVILRPDADTPSEGRYSVLPDDAGNFCQVLYTERGVLGGYLILHPSMNIVTVSPQRMVQKK
jgi:hypothetical protein